ncbi:primosomal replication protein PriC [Thalassotalea euphylliae]|uniref:primosomal replication protein PriC n=1 Tax=Thalassotalea euphylliae TaxID=1655234 RepID=UPI00362BFAD8
MRTNSKLLSKLAELIAQIKNDAMSLQKTKSSNSYSERYIIENNIFATRSYEYLDYISETENKLKQLEQCLNKQQMTYAATLAEQIENQCGALVTAIASHQTRQKKIRAATPSFKQNKYKKIAQKVMLPTHALYAKLAEHHEFERRLALMITEREYERAKAKQEKAAQLSAEILALHQRLGRCRKAISTIERDIEMAEKRPS